MDINRWLKKWGPIIGGFAGACGLIISAITVYILIAQHKAKAKLTAEVYFENWRAPRSVTSDLIGFEGARSLFKGQDPNNHSHFEKVHNGLNAVWVMLDGEPNYSAHNIGKMLCMCSITITNEGGGPATNVIMDFSDANHIEFYGGGIPEKEPRESMDKIFYQLEESLPQEEKIMVQVWTKCKPERECADKLNISCTEDTASIDVLIPVRSFPQWMSDYPKWTFFTLIIVWSCIHAGVWIRRRRRTKKAGT